MDIPASYVVVGASLEKQIWMDVSTKDASDAKADAAHSS
jgi:hypothetical protein